MLQDATQQKGGCTLFGYRVHDPERYGVLELGEGNRVVSIEEKPAKPKSRIAVTGLYFYDNQVVHIARHIAPSARGELEITDVNRAYVERGEARVHVMGRGMTWLDTGTYQSLLEAAQFVQVLEQRQGTHIACIEEIAFRMGYIDRAALGRLAAQHGKSDYGRYLRDCAEEG
jgi:glucose-1-phosphate thymidylyltransferase